MSDNVYFKASLQNTLIPEVGTFNNVNNKEGTFTLEDGEYYLTNNTDTSYRVYYPTENINSVGFTIEFDVNYDNAGGFGWCLLFNGTYWFGIGVVGESLEFRGQSLPNYRLITSPNTWLHVKCIFDYDNNPNKVHIYVNNSEVNTFTISNNYGIKYIDILGYSGGYVPHAKIKNIIIYNSSKKYYLDTTGLTSLWSKIKSLFATKTELASKANSSDVYNKSETDTLLSNLVKTSDLATVATTGSYNDLLDKPTSFDVDLSNYYTKPEIDGLLSYIGGVNSVYGGMSITADESEGGYDAQGGLSFYNAVERAPGYDGTSQITIAEDANTVEDE